MSRTDHQHQYTWIWPSGKPRVLGLRLERGKGWGWMEWIDLIKLRRRQTTSTTTENGRRMRKGDKRKIERTVAQLQHYFREFVFSPFLSHSRLPFCAFPSFSFFRAHSFRDLTWRTISYPVIAPLLFPTDDRLRERERMRNAKSLAVWRGTRMKIFDNLLAMNMLHFVTRAESPKETFLRCEI